MMENSKQIVKIAYEALDKHLGEDIKVIDISKVSQLADYFVIAHGNNAPQIQALYDAVDEALTKAGISAKSIEGISSASWILMDYGDVVVHIFSEKDRKFYDLERIWKDGTITEVNEI